MVIYVLWPRPIVAVKKERLTIKPKLSGYPAVKKGGDVYGELALRKG